MLSMGNGDPQLYVSICLKIANLKGGYWDEDVTINGVPFRKLSPEYLTWLRRNHTGEVAESETLRSAIKEHHPELVGIRREPIWCYLPPDEWSFSWDDNRLWADGEGQEEAVGERAESRVHVLRDSGKPSVAGAGGSRDREEKPRAQELVARVQRTFDM